MRQRETEKKGKPKEPKKQLVLAVDTEDHLNNRVIRSWTLGLQGGKTPEKTGEENRITPPVNCFKGTWVTEGGEGENTRQFFEAHISKCGPQS